MKLINSLCVGAGHAAPGKGACGAVGYINESLEARQIRNKVIELNNKRFWITDCTVDSGTQSAVLTQAVKKANASGCDLDLQIHFNACKKSAKDGKAKGVEALIYANTSSKAKSCATQLAAEIAKGLGVPNRGVKCRKDLYFLKKTSKPAVILEVCFCDDEDDYLAYKKKNGREVVANAILHLFG